jgi:hypothetical protein
MCAALLCYAMLSYCSLNNSTTLIGAAVLVSSVVEINDCDDDETLEKKHE